jgi:hypothetical protein
VHLVVEQALGQGDVGDGGEEVVAALRGDAAVVQLLGQPAAAVAAAADGAGEPALQPDVAPAEVGVAQVVVGVGAADRLLAGLDQPLGVAAEAVGPGGLLAGQQRPAAGGAAVALGQVEGDGFLVDVGAVEVAQGHVAARFEGLAAQGLGEVFGVVGEVLEAEALLGEVARDAAGVLEQARLAGEAEAVEAGQDEADAGGEAG